MNIAHRILVFEDIKGATFVTTSRKVYGVEFTNSTIHETNEKLELLKHNITNNVKVGVHGINYLTVEEVNNIFDAFNDIVEYYKKTYSLRGLPPKTSYKVIVAKLKEVSLPTKTIEQVQDLHSNFIEDKKKTESLKDKLGKKAKTDVANRFKPKNSK